MIGDPLPFLIDEDVPESAVGVLRERGHTISYVREMTARGTPDPVVASLGDRVRAIVVTCNAKDFKSIAGRVPVGNRLQFRRLGILALKCRQSQAANRLRHHMESIEFHFARVQGHADKRLIIELMDSKLNVYD